MCIKHFFILYKQEFWKLNFLKVWISKINTLNCANKNSMSRVRLSRRVKIVCIKNHKIFSLQPNLSQLLSVSSDLS